MEKKKGKFREQFKGRMATPLAVARHKQAPTKSPAACIPASLHSLQLFLPKRIEQQGW